MRYSTSSVLTAAFLIVEVAAVHRGHRHRHRDVNVVTVWDDVYETVTDVVWVTVGGEEPTTTSSVETTSTAAPVVPTTSSIVSAVTSSSISPADDADELPTVVSVAPTTFSTVASSTTSVAPPPPSTTSIAPPPPSTTSIAPPPPPSTTSIAPPPPPSTTSIAPPPPPSTTSIAPPPPPTTSTVVTPTAPAATSGGKRGVAYNDASVLSLFEGQSTVSWTYNWGSSPGGTIPAGIEYVPLLWCTTEGFTSDWAANAQAAIDAGSTHLQGFNEPDLSSQCNISPGDAAAGWMTYMEPFAGQAALGSPAVTNGGPPLGLSWLGDFIEACSGCSIDHINLHWYASATDFAYFTEYIESAYTAGGQRPIWITEFQGLGDDADQVSFLETVMPWLDSLGYIERYSYFMAETGILLDSESSLSDIGTTYTGYTSSAINDAVLNV